MYAEDEARLLLQAGGDLESMVRRRESGEPLEYIVGWARFDGLRIPVVPGVFIPRRRTEALLEQVLLRLRPGACVLDLCCGAAPVAIALASRGVTVWACDIDPLAVECARRSLPDVACGDLFEALPRLRFDVVVANAPYVPRAALDMLPRESLFESSVALDGGMDGLAVHRRIGAQVGRWLVPGGLVVTECSPGQAIALAGIYGVAEIVFDDLRDVAVVIGAPRPGAATP